MGVKSAERVLEIFELLKNYPDGLTAKEISMELGYAGSSTFELVKTLSENGYLWADENKRYMLGARLIQLGPYASSYLDLNKIAAQPLKDMMEALQETVFMAVLSGEEIVYVAKVDNYRSISNNARLGGRKPIYCTGLGKAFLTFLPEKEREELVSRLEFTPYTKNTITTKEDLYKQLETFREQGYSIDNEEIEVGLWCAAAPVFGSNGRVEAAVSVAGPTVRMLENKEKIVRTLLKVTRELSEKMGYTGRIYGK